MFYRPITTNNIASDDITSWPRIDDASFNPCQINSYDEAFEFKEFDEKLVYIKTSVLTELVSRIKELEEANAKNWAELLKEEE